MGYNLVGGSENIMINHPAIVRRLNRADGHLQKIIEMIEAGKPCALLAQQLQAVENAIENAKKALIHDHIGHCLMNRSKRPDLQGGCPCGN
jgi:DNA-binding FrmR family transcriptional regulator